MKLSIKDLSIIESSLEKTVKNSFEEAIQGPEWVDDHSDEIDIPNFSRRSFRETSEIFELFMQIREQRIDLEETKTNGLARFIRSLQEINEMVKSGECKFNPTTKQMEFGEL